MVRAAHHALVRTFGAPCAVALAQARCALHCGSKLVPTSSVPSAGWLFATLPVRAFGAPCAIALRSGALRASLRQQAGAHVHWPGGSGWSLPIVSVQRCEAPRVGEGCRDRGAPGVEAPSLCRPLGCPVQSPDCARVLVSQLWGSPVGRWPMGSAHPGDYWLLWAGCVLILGAGCQYSVRTSQDEKTACGRNCLLLQRYCSRRPSFVRYVLCAIPPAEGGRGQSTPLGPSWARAG